MMTFAELPIYYLLCALQYSVEPSRNPTVSRLQTCKIHIRIRTIGQQNPMFDVCIRLKQKLPLKGFYEQNDTFRYLALKNTSVQDDCGGGGS
jgi:hypothetical protein